MKLRARARLLALVSVLVFLTLLGALLIADQEKSQAERDLGLTESLIFQTIQLRTALFDSLVRPQTQPRSQSETQFDLLQGLLERESGAIDAAIRNDPQTRYAWESVRRLVREIRELYAELGHAGADPGLAERDRRTTDLILVNGHSLILFVSQLRHRAGSGFLQATAWENLALAVMLAGLAGLGLLLFAVFERAVLRPLHQIYKAAVRVADGETGLRMRSTRIDELGELADAFDRMLDQLQETTVSRDRLEAEIAARKLAQRALRALNVDLERRVEQRTAELQTANRELESFAYAVSHDLRAPLRALSGFSQALAEDYAERFTGEAREYLNQIDRASRRMGDLIDGILTLSRSTRGELRREPVDVSALARRLHQERAAAEPGRRIALEVEPGLSIRGDPAMLEAALRNLIENAWKYTAKVPAASVRVYAEDRPGPGVPGRWTCVADNGAGFDMADCERLFNPFQRLHRQDEFPGIGIGLATVQRIVHRHGGIIEAEGAPGRGAIFRFTLPDPE